MVVRRWWLVLGRDDDTPWIGRGGSLGVGVGGGAELFLLL